MAETFSEDQPFVVKNSIGILLVIMIFSGMIFISSIPYGLNYYAITLGLVPALVSITGLIVHKPVIIVDRTGIYASGRFITDWSHFVHAGFTEIPVTGGYKDNFVLIVEYSKAGIEGYFRSTIALTDTENKSEEAVVAAINFFFNNNKVKSKGFSVSDPVHSRNS